jgi:hypothetical protein
MACLGRTGRRPAMVDLAHPRAASTPVVVEWARKAAGAGPDAPQHPHVGQACVLQTAH